ncbi:hypothetical protein GGS23DRAFT_280376 [Durotheca rogersii]|uniref:uncharacterized protein n=1 Tax=Durotheca rogersii TaxID=419775 RepID=UPI00221E45D2|nr:uncharacterized protein GGS23DRAFT_280376 [Durotheca rogersii]KAI5866632.1 hypothetical protein GGS23DRAFT_280376 [Durotheca rogersii]
MEEEATVPLPANLEPISRPSSTSTTASAVQKLAVPAVAALAAAGGSVTSSPQLSCSFRDCENSSFLEKLATSSTSAGYISRRGRPEHFEICSWR